MELLGARDYRPYLRSILEVRVAANGHYSLRAFARDLGMTPQMLSYVLNSKAGISLDAAAEIAERLGLNPNEASYFVDLVTFVHARSPQARKLAEFRLNERVESGPKYQSLELEAFKAISDWYHCAVLELAMTDDFRSDPKWIAGRLGVTVFEATQALNRLKALELLEEVKPGVVRRTELNLSASFGVPSSALRKLAKQYLEKAIDSLETQSIDERDITNMTMAIDPSLLPKAKEMIAGFRRKLCTFLEQGKRTEVYVFAPSLFRITQAKKPRGQL